MQTWQVVILAIIGLLAVALCFFGWVVDLLQIEDAMGRRRKDGAKRENERI